MFRTIYCILLGVRISLTVIPGNTAAQTVAVLSVSSETVGLYEKFEIIASISGVSYTNPYDPDQIDLRAVFTAPSGKQWEIYGFYDNYLSRNQWKVRFSANETGEWTYYLWLATPADTITGSEHFFSATESVHHGWLRISPDNPHYLIHDDGTSFYGVGAYYPWGVKDGTGGLATLEASGANIWGYWNIMYGGEGTILESLDSGLGRYDQPKCNRIDQLIQWSENRNLKMMFAIWPHDLLSNTVWAHQWHQNPYKSVTGVEDFFASEEAWLYQEKQYRYIIARWGYSRAMGIWEIVNEVNGTDGWVAGNTTEARIWVGRVHDYLTAHDPFGRPTTASMSGGHYWSEGYAEVDLPNVHLYETGWPAQYPGNPLRSSAYIYRYISSRLRTDFDKPCILGEAGYYDTYGGFDIPSAQYTALYHNALWASWSGGLAVTPFWWSYDDKTLMGSAVMGQMKSFAAVVMGFDYTRMKVSPVLLDVQDGDGYAMKGQNGMFGWVREHYGNSIGGKRITVTGLADTSYQVIWFNTWNGELLQRMYTGGLDATAVFRVPPGAEDLPDVAFFLEEAEEGITPYYLNLEVSQEELRARSTDTVFVYVTLHDVEGRFCGKATNPVTFSLSGPGALLGSTVANAVGGQASIRFIGDSLAGEARIVASSPGLVADTVAIDIISRVTIDDFDSYRSDDVLRNVWKERSGTTVEFGLYDSDPVEGTQSLLVNYAIGDGNAPYAGVYTNLDMGDLSAIESLEFWLKPDASNRMLAILLKEDGSCYWQYDYPLAGCEVTRLDIPLTAFISSDGAEEMQRDQLNEISFNILKGEGDFGEGMLILDAIAFRIPAIETHIQKPSASVVPVSARLWQNYPNPFNGETVIRYSVGSRRAVTLSIYNLLGQKIATLVSGIQSAGEYNIKWDGTGYSSGVYLYRLTWGKKIVQTRKLLFLK